MTSLLSEFRRVLAELRRKTRQRAPRAAIRIKTNSYEWRLS